ncbi:Tat pathway signal sequence domain protein [Streptomyces sp. NPDC046862]|uniref:Tat pathway signal sequence domain protein n=1 Tax=Streptomyces sp. NPDC046862 TaxID=3154603 RepID=UPI003456BA05
MRKIVRRHLGKVVAGAGIAVAGTAVMVGITLPGSVSADESGGTGQQNAQQAAGQGQAEGQGAVRPGTVEEAPAEGDKGTGLDPLTDDEMKRVEQIALNRTLLNSSENAEGKRGPERLNVELAEPSEDELDDASAPRRADVRFYDYKNDTVVTKTVNLDTGKVETTDTQRGVQPPFSPAESAEAAKLLIADPVGAGLKADYKDATGKELTSPDQLVVAGMVFRADAGTKPETLAKCGEQRCVRLFTKVKNGPWIDTRNLIIDLSTRKVAKLG